MTAPLTPDCAAPRGLRATLVEAITITTTLALCAAAGGLWAILERMIP